MASGGMIFVPSFMKIRHSRNIKVIFSRIGEAMMLVLLTDRIYEVCH
jgi:hypothetical protein